MDFILQTLGGSWHLLMSASVYVLFGIFMAGMLKLVLRPDAVLRHLGEGRFLPVVKAAIIGVPLPLCSCAVLPAAASLRRQGANNGATTAFLISTPESGIDSISITYALLDPLMTVARPVVAMVTATVAGLAENLCQPPNRTGVIAPELSCPVDGCCNGVNCPTEAHENHHPLAEKFSAAMRYAFDDLWGDIAGWFFVGILLAGLINVLIPADALRSYLGGGLGSMLLMLVIGMPMYICATASTPIGATLILKGVSPGAALVFLLAGPATNMTSLTVLLKILGTRATAIYLVSIAILSVMCGLVLDQVYASFGVSAQAMVGQAAEVVPAWGQRAGALVLLGLSVRPAYRFLQSRLHGDHDHEVCAAERDRGNRHE